MLEYQLDQIKIVNFLLIDNFWPRELFSAHPLPVCLFSFFANLSKNAPELTPSGQSAVVSICPKFLAARYSTPNTRELRPRLIAGCAFLPHSRARHSSTPRHSTTPTHGYASFRQHFSGSQLSAKDRTWGKQLACFYFPFAIQARR